MTTLGLNDKRDVLGVAQDMATGLLVGLTQVFFAVSIASLIFTGPASHLLMQGIGIALVSTTVVSIIVAVVSSTPGVMGRIQDSPNVLLAVMVAALVSNGANDSTIFMVLMLATLLTGAFLLSLALFRLGGMVRYLPYPVIGGFLAGTGWLLVIGALKVMVKVPESIVDLPQLLQPPLLLLWLPGAILGLVLFSVQRLIKNALVLPGSVVGIAVLTILILRSNDGAAQEAMKLGLLLGDIGSAQWTPLTNITFREIDWGLLLNQAGTVGTMLAVTSVSLLLTASGLEVSTRQEVRLNRELLTAGVANLITGISGGMVGFQSQSLTSLADQFHSRSRLVGVFSGLVCLFALGLGHDLLPFVPRALLGGLLLFIGLNLLVDWIIKGWQRFSREEYAIVLLILVVIIVTNFLIGVAVGLVAMVIMFVISYIQVSVVRNTFSGDEVHSNVARNRSHRQALAYFGKQIHALQLQGFIFFGTAFALFEQVKKRVQDSEYPAVRFLILDFARVSGLDSSAALSFDKILMLAEAQNLCVVLTAIDKEQLERLNIGSTTTPRCQLVVIEDMDRGLEWCEDQLLEEESVTVEPYPFTIEAQLAREGFSTDTTHRLLAYMTPIEIAAGERLIQQGDQADCLYYLPQGRVSIFLEMDGQQQVRLRSLGEGTLVGEVGLYLGEERIASIIADEPTSAYQLTKQGLDEMKEDDPALAGAFHELVARLLSERLKTSNRLVSILLK